MGVQKGVCDILFDVASSYTCCSAGDHAVLQVQVHVDLLASISPVERGVAQLPWTSPLSQPCNSQPSWKSGPYPGPCPAGCWGEKICSSQLSLPGCWHFFHSPGHRDPWRLEWHSFWYDLQHRLPSGSSTRHPSRWIHVSLIPKEIAISLWRGNARAWINRSPTLAQSVDGMMWLHPILLHVFFLYVICSVFGLVLFLFFLWVHVEWAWAWLVYIGEEQRTISIAKRD